MVHSDEQIQEQVKQFIVTTFFLDPATVKMTPSTSFLSEGIIDSTGILEVVGYLESTYGIKVEDTEMLPQNLDSLGNISRFVRGKAGA